MTDPWLRLHAGDPEVEVLVNMDHVRAVWPVLIDGQPSGALLTFSNHVTGQHDDCDLRVSESREHIMHRLHERARTQQML